MLHRHWLKSKNGPCAGQQWHRVDLESKELGQPDVEQGPINIGDVPCGLVWGVQADLPNIRGSLQRAD
eukprot:3974198-Amphidinium_carterae.1